MPKKTFKLTSPDGLSDPNCFHCRIAELANEFLSDGWPAPELIIKTRQFLSEFLNALPWESPKEKQTAVVIIIKQILDDTD